MVEPITCGSGHEPSLGNDSSFVSNNKARRTQNGSKLTYVRRALICREKSIDAFSKSCCLCTAGRSSPFLFTTKMAVLGIPNLDMYKTGYSSLMLRLNQKRTRSVICMQHVARYGYPNNLFFCRFVPLWPWDCERLDDPTIVFPVTT
ncbi:hypothetical protein CY34DRAFT_246036 [Suillus luteus UH-Slu-Lm8-n1]|uniref:Uncharacterized protein n=1 Tax=Suillus luteus UH-Slu-Lm8-n1 TaxID=930992 RepID=A0A0D0AAU2_9AGAM|nr:hypothetical protein CY34DRAFT_246036 [Suillus luteus UH-Slu-Lm8-n1]